MEPPEKFNSYWQAGGADLIKGHIGTGVHSSITRIKKEEMQTKITEDNVLLISSGRATQWVFMQYDSIISRSHQRSKGRKSREWHTKAEFAFYVALTEHPILTQVLLCEMNHCKIDPNT